MIPLLDCFYQMAGLYDRFCSLSSKEERKHKRHNTKINYFYSIISNREEKKKILNYQLAAIKFLKFKTPLYSTVCDTFYVLFFCPGLVPRLLKIYKKSLTLVLLNLDMPCLCKQCKSRSVGFFRCQQLVSKEASCCLLKKPTDLSLQCLSLK